jgi:putative aminopeptidase FrvX
MIPTAEEFLKLQDCQQSEEGAWSWVTKEDLIEFAKMHVEEALKQASGKAKVKITQGDFGVFDTRPSVKKKSILNAYPLENIK